jgi:UDPglucose 6-dehydrogenase
MAELSIFGLGKLGLPLAACLAAKGYDVIGVDSDAAKIEAVNKGMPPLFEPGLEELLLSVRDRLTATQDGQRAVMQSEATFIFVPTPSEPDGSFSPRYVLQVCESVAAALRHKQTWHLVVVRSTLSPGSMDNVIRPFLEAQSGKRCGRDFGLCYNPEFIALGSVIRDILNPDFVIIGESDPKAGDVMEGIYRRLCENSPPVVRMNFVNAELAKLAVNTFVTTKINFANMLARICERLPGADVDVVTGAVGLDSRIGPKFLKGAIAYGGPCFPRDNKALAALARSVDVPATLAEANDRFNERQMEWLVRLVEDWLPEGGCVGVLGLAYKPGTEVVEGSQGLVLAERLVDDGVSVVAYDPAAMGNARRVLHNRGRVTFAASAEECVRKADVVVITTPWDEFKRLSISEFKRHSPPRVLIDCWRVHKGKVQDDDGLIYVPIGIRTARG